MIKYTKLPNIHPKVDLEDLEENAKLLGDSLIKYLIKRMKDLPDGKYRKEELTDILIKNPLKELKALPYEKNREEKIKFLEGLGNIKFSIVKSNGRLYAEYHGAYSILFANLFHCFSPTHSIKYRPTIPVLFANT